MRTGTFVIDVSIWSDGSTVGSVTITCSDGTVLPEVRSTHNGGPWSWSSVNGYKSISYRTGAAWDRWDNPENGNCCGGNGGIPGSMICPSGQLFAGFTKINYFKDHLGTFTAVCHTPCPAGMHALLLTISF